MDGTLLNNKGEISDQNRKAIRLAEEKGVSVIISTGRSILTCRDHAASLNLSSYLITVNGSEIWGPSGELIERNKVDSKLVKWMWDLSQTHKTNYWATGTSQVWRNEMPVEIEANEWLKFGFDIKDDKVRQIIMEELEKKEVFEISNSSPTNIEVNALGVNKAQGIKRICERLDIEITNVMAVGDSLNDIAMIKEAGFGVAMGNAQQVVKEAADWTTLTNDEDGVAHAIFKWVM